MADILLLKRKHFAEDVQPPEWSAVKWAGRPRQGDVIEVRETGYFRIEALGSTSGIHGWDKDAFMLLRITSLDPLTVAYLQEAYTNRTATQPATVVYNYRFRFALWASIPWIIAPMPDGKEEWYYVRNTLSGLAALTATDKVTG